MTPHPPDDDVVAAAYDQWSETYDVDRNTTRDLDAAALRQQDLQLDGADVLEVGCGTGKNTRWLAARARSVLALDFSDGMLRKARENVEANHVRFVRHDIRYTWPAEKDSFDVVIIDLVLEHIRDLAPVFSEAARVLRAGGSLFVCELHPFKQLAGSQARFTTPETDEVQRVEAYRHDVSEFLNAGLAAGLRLARADEWRDAAGGPASPPRLFSMLWAR